jgi:hypothetical protein
VLAFGAAAGALAAEGALAAARAGAAAGLLAVAGAVDLLAAGAAAGVAGAAAVDISALAAFLDLLFFAGVAASALAAGLAAASALAVLLVAVLSFASALLLFFVALLLLDVAASLEAAASVLAAFAVDLLLDLVDFEESAVVSVLLCGASLLAAFFLVFFLEEVVASLWSVEEVDPDCCAIRAEILPLISSSAANSDRNTPLLHLMVFSPSATDCRDTEHTHSGGGVGADSGRSRLAVRAYVAGMGASSRRTQGKSRRNGA